MSCNCKAHQQYITIQSIQGHWQKVRDKNENLPRKIGEVLYSQSTFEVYLLQQSRIVTFKRQRRIYLLRSQIKVQPINPKRRFDLARKNTNGWLLSHL